MICCNTTTLRSLCCLFVVVVVVIAAVARVPFPQYNSLAQVSLVGFRRSYSSKSRRPTIFFFLDVIQDLTSDYFGTRPKYRGEEL